MHKSDNIFPKALQLRAEGLELIHSLTPHLCLTQLLFLIFTNVFVMQKKQAECLKWGFIRVSPQPLRV